MPNTATYNFTEQDLRDFTHDLLNPLAVAQGTIEVCIEQAKNESRPANDLRRLERLQEAVHRMIEIIRERRLKHLPQMTPKIPPESE